MKGGGGRYTQQHKYLTLLDLVHPQFCNLIFYSGFLNVSDEKNSLHFFCTYRTKFKMCFHSAFLSLTYTETGTQHSRV